MRIPFWRRQRREDQLDEELRMHLQMAVRARIERGEPPAQAECRARREMGNDAVIRDVTRRMWGWMWLEHFLQDARYGLRSLVRAPGFTLVAMIALALGIGANTAVFSVVDAVLLRPLPYADPGRLVVVLNEGRNPVSPADYLDWRAQNRVFENMGAAEYWTPNLSGTSAGDDKPEKVYGLRLTSSVLPTLGVQPLLGRVFGPESDEAGTEHEVVLSYGLWRRRFAGDPRILGQPIVLSGEKYTVVAVMPAAFQFAPFWATRAELWAPLPFGKDAMNRARNSLRVFARLKPGVSLSQARAETATITARLAQQYPGSDRDVRVVPLAEKVSGDVRTALLILLGAVGFVLLIACANVAHMLLARAAVRQREIAVRAALGAGRLRIVRQFLTESVLLSLLGAAAGLFLAWWGTRALVALAGASIPRADAIAMDGRVLLFMVAVSLVTGVAFGLAPAWHASLVDLNDALKDGGRGSSEGIRRNRMRSALVASEFAMALVLLVGAGLMIRSFMALQAIDPGWDPHHVVTMMVSVAGSGSEAPGRRTVFYEEAVRRVGALPGVESASLINHIPLAGDLWALPFYVEGRPSPAPGDELNATYRVTYPGYFRTMRISLLAGRDFTARDNANAPGVAVVNEHLARTVWPGENAIGKRVTFHDPRGKPQWRTVVGVVRDVRRGQWVEDADNETYIPLLQEGNFLTRSGWNYETLVVRTKGDPAAAVPAIDNAIWSVDRTVTLAETMSMKQIEGDATAQPRFYLLLLGSFGAIALVLAAVGIYGVMSYSVSRRRQEISIRMTLGARRKDVVAMVVGQGMLLALIGGAAGLVAAVALTQSMSKLLYGIRPTDAATFTVVPLVLGMTAFLATFIPAMRATRIDPIQALRRD